MPPPPRHRPHAPSQSCSHLSLPLLPPFSIMTLLFLLLPLSPSSRNLRYFSLYLYSAIISFLVFYSFSQFSRICLYFIFSFHSPFQLAFSLLFFLSPRFHPPSSFPIFFIFSLLSPFSYPSSIPLFFHQYHYSGYSPLPLSLLFCFSPYPLFPFSLSFLLLRFCLGNLFTASFYFFVSY